MAFGLRTALLAVGMVANAFSLAAGQASDLPIYCRLLAVGLQDVSFQPVIEDFNFSMAAQVPDLGPIDLSLARAEIGAAHVVGCDASVDPQGRFNLAVSQLDLDIKQLQWQYQQQKFPRIGDRGFATASAGLSFKVSIDIAKGERQVFALALDKLELDLGAQEHSQLAKELEKLAKFMRPLVSDAVEIAAKKVLDSSLDTMHRKGGCAFLQGSLAGLGAGELQFTSFEPLEAKVPVIGAVNVSVNSTSIELPTSMRCDHAGFAGTTLTAHVHEVPLSAQFLWAFQKIGSARWHNQGTGSAKILAGGLIHIDLLNATATQVQVELPTLDLQLTAEADTWMYKAVTKALSVLARNALQIFGGMVVEHFIAKCLADPTCPRVPPPPPPAPATTAVPSAATSAGLEIVV